MLTARAICGIKLRHILKSYPSKGDTKSSSFSQGIEDGGVRIFLNETSTN
jgi:hypothetical protein